MKIKYIFASLLTAGVILSSCSGGGNGTKFNPSEKEDTMSAADRKEAIADARDRANGIVDEMLEMRGVKVSVVAPKPAGDITSTQAQQIATKLVNICAQNGISALGNDPIFVLGVEIIPGEKAATGTAPQKMTVQYELIYNVGNARTGDIYASCTQTITGAGKSYEAATRNALKQIKPSGQLNKMLSEASDRIVKWYDENLPTLKAQVEEARGNGNLALAMAMVSSVPQQCKEAFEWASQVRPGLFEAWKKQTADNNLAAMKAAIAATDDEFNPEVAAYFTLIPADSPQYKAAEEMFGKYRTACQAKIDREIQKVRDDSALVQQYRLQLRTLEMPKELAKIDADRAVAVAEAKASAVAMQRDMQAARDEKNRGFWSKLGDRVLNGIDSLGSDDDE